MTPGLAGPADPGSAAASAEDNAGPCCAWCWTKSKYTIFGIMFGLCFPVAAVLLDIFANDMALSWDSVVVLFATDRAESVIASAPLVLGILFHLVGRSQARLQQSEAALKAELAARQQAEEELRHRATHDPLTGLPNRRRLAEEIDAVLARLRRIGGSCGVYLIDLDRFKLVNDLHGHQAGDELLQAVAQRLRDTVREVDTAARLGGDEFAVLTFCSQTDQAEDAARLARRMIAALETPFILQNSQVLIGASIGIALAPADGTDAETLLQRADLAMYRSKSQARGTFRFFEPGMDARIRERAALEADLRFAVMRDELEPHFQPLIELSTGRIVSYELLARWNHATRGMVPPAEFIPVAEDTGLIGQVTERLLRRGCAIANNWPDDVVLAVNISPLQLRDQSLPGVIRKVVAATGIAPRRLELELTESALVADFDLARDILTELKAIGVRLAIDDFGTGYSSLNHLQALPFDQIKIDASFIRAMVATPESRKIVAAVVGLGHSLGLLTVAEGVEDERQSELLRSLGCDVAQGFLYGQAVPYTELPVAIESPQTAAAL